MKIDRHERNSVKLDGVSFIALMLAPGAMADGNIKIGLIIDDRASDEQVDAVGAIASGSDGGPMAALAPLVAEMAGEERGPIVFEGNGIAYTVTTGHLIDQGLRGVPNASKAGEPIYRDNIPNPATWVFTAGYLKEARGRGWIADTATRSC